MLQTLKTGLETLRFVAMRDGACQPADIAEALDISLGKTYNIIRTLISEGMLQRAADGTLRLGAYGVGLRQGLLLASRPSGVDPKTLLDEVAEATGETVYMTMLINDRIVITRIVESAHNVRVGGLKEGYGSMPHARASARAVLAHLPAADVRRMVGPEPFAVLTPSTRTDYASLEEGFGRIRNSGYALEREEYQPEVCCVAAPLMSAAGGPIGSIAVSGPLSRIGTRLEELGATLVTRIGNPQATAEPA